MNSFVLVYFSLWGKQPARPHRHNICTFSAKYNFGTCLFVKMVGLAVAMRLGVLSVDRVLWSDGDEVEFSIAFAVSVKGCTGVHLGIAWSWSLTARFAMMIWQSSSWIGIVDGEGDCYTSASRSGPWPFIWNVSLQITAMLQGFIYKEQWGICG